MHSWGELLAENRGENVNNPPHGHMLVLAATTIIEGLPVVSVDAIFDQLPDVRRIW